MAIVDGWLSLEGRCGCVTPSVSSGSVSHVVGRSRDIQTLMRCAGAASAGAGVVGEGRTGSLTPHPGGTLI